MFILISALMLHTRAKSREGNVGGGGDEKEEEEQTEIKRDSIERSLSSSPSTVCKTSLSLFLSPSFLPLDSLKVSLFLASCCLTAAAQEKECMNNNEIKCPRDDRGFAIFAHAGKYHFAIEKSDRAQLTFPLLK